MKTCKISSSFIVLILLSGCISKKEEFAKEPFVCNTKTVRRDALIQASQDAISMALPSIESQFSGPLVAKPVSEKDEAERCEAHLLDIPVPVVAAIESAIFDENGAIKFAYTVSLTRDVLVDFYRQEMERFGWVQESSFVGGEVLLSFKKPHKACIVSLRPEKKIWEKSKNIKVCLFLSA